MPKLTGSSDSEPNHSMIQRHLALKFALVVFVCVCAPIYVGRDGHAQVASPLYQLPVESITVTTAEGARCTFQTVVVRSSADQARGLMHVRDLRLNQSMLFLYPDERPRSMWMKNTIVSLDMWFIDREGVVQHVVRYTTPQSLKSIPSESPVLAVLEINAGLSDMLGVKKGAKVSYPAFD